MSQRSLPSSGRPRLRRSCEPCRKKKTKCPGEYPVCSFCQRLNQACTYGSRRSIHAGIDRGGDSSGLGQISQHDRIAALERHIEQLYNLLDTNEEVESFRGMPDPPSEASTMRETISISPTEIPRTLRYEDNNRSKTTPNEVWASRQSPPPAVLNDASRLLPALSDRDNQIMNRAMKVYEQKMHCQPLPLFCQRLTVDATEWPTHLGLSLLSIASFLSKDLLDDQDRLMYHQRARSEVLARVAENDNSTEILQSLCLIALGDIANGNKVAAWTDIGIGSRLATAFGAPPYQGASDEWIGAYWSLFMLDKIYGTSVSMAPAFTNRAGPPYPKSSLLSTQAPLSHDTSSLGATACCIELLNTWSHAVEFIQSLRWNEDVDVCMNSSSYHKVMSELYRIETKIGEVHRLRNIKLLERHPSELETNRGYWAPWFTMQNLYHAIQALINHPFCHIVNLNGQRPTGPPSFLQHTIDQSLLHSGWVARFIDICKEKRFEINDPFMAHIATIAATVFMFFLDAGEKDLAEQAEHGLKTCYDFIQTTGITWPHINKIVHKLDILKRSRTSAAYSSVTAPSVQGSLLWDLLSYSTSTTHPMINQTPTSRENTVQLNVPTQFLYPLESVSANRQDRASQHQPLEDMGLDTLHGHLGWESPSHSNENDEEFNSNIFDPDFFTHFHTHGLSSNCWIDLG